MLNGKYQLDRIAEFFEFIYDRQEIWHRRNVLNLPAPWSTDEILRNYRFCNVYRELDGGTLALTKYLTDESISVGKKLFNIVAYRFFNRRDTIENLFGGLLDPENFDFEAFEARFDAKRNQEHQKHDQNQLPCFKIIISSCQCMKNRYRKHDVCDQGLHVVDAVLVQQLPLPA